jgi:predicted Zn-ribbon and HTH transcriptional regulator
MLRKDLQKMIVDNPMSVAALARLLRLKSSEVEDDLEHLFKSARHTEFEPVVEPALCKKCGFEFSQETLGKPSKCPACKGSWIAEAKVSFKRRSEADSA